MKYFIFVSLLLLVANLGFGGVGEPIQQFLKTYGPDDAFPDDKLIVALADLNNDGIDEVFLSFKETNRYADGHLWAVYHYNGEKWVNPKIVDSDGSVEKGAVSIIFPNEATVIGDFDEIDARRGMAHYFKDNPSGTLIVDELVDGKIIKHVISDFAPSGKDKERYQELFGGSAEFMTIKADEYDRATALSWLAREQPEETEESLSEDVDTDLQATKLIRETEQPQKPAKPLTDIIPKGTSVQSETSWPVSMLSITFITLLLAAWLLYRVSRK